MFAYVVIVCSIVVLFAVGKESWWLTFLFSILNHCHHHICHHWSWSHKLPCCSSCWNYFDVLDWSFPDPWILFCDCLSCVHTHLATTGLLSGICFTTVFSFALLLIEFWDSSLTSLKCVPLKLFELALFGHSFQGWMCTGKKHLFHIGFSVVPCFLLIVWFFSLLVEILLFLIPANWQLSLWLSLAMAWLSSSKIYDTFEDIGHVQDTSFLNLRTFSEKSLWHQSHLRTYVLCP